VSGTFWSDEKVSGTFWSAIPVDRLIEVDARSGHADEPVGELLVWRKRCQEPFGVRFSSIASSRSMPGLVMRMNQSGKRSASALGTAASPAARSRIARTSPPGSACAAPRAGAGVPWSPRTIDTRPVWPSHVPSVAASRYHCNRTKCQELRAWTLPGSLRTPPARNSWLVLCRHHPPQELLAQRRHTGILKLRPRVIEIERYRLHQICSQQRLERSPI
jgi:hypothetical protein